MAASFKFNASTEVLRLNGFVEEFSWYKKNISRQDNTVIYFYTIGKNGIVRVTKTKGKRTTISFHIDGLEVVKTEYIKQLFVYFQNELLF